MAYLHPDRHIKMYKKRGTGARPTNGISIEFEIRSKFWELKFEIRLTNHSEILYTSRQLHCREVCEISLWSVAYILDQSTANFYQTGAMTPNNQILGQTFLVVENDFDSI